MKLDEGRYNKVKIVNPSRIGCLVNRLAKIIDKIDYDWLNLSFNTFKLKCKNLFLTLSKHVVYFDQLLGIAGTQKLIKTNFGLFSFILNFFKQNQPKVGE